MFDEWVKIGYHKLRIRYFDNIIQMALGMPAEMCQLAVSCGYLVLEHNGDIYPCDFFVESEWQLGNVHEQTIGDMVSGPLFRQFNSMKPEVNEECTRCQWRPLCHGGVSALPDQRRRQPQRADLLLLVVQAVLLRNVVADGARGR